MNKLSYIEINHTISSIYGYIKTFAKQWCNYWLCIHYSKFAINNQEIVIDMLRKQCCFAKSLVFFFHLKAVFQVFSKTRSCIVGWETLGLTTWLPSSIRFYRLNSSNIQEKKLSLIPCSETIKKLSAFLTCYINLWVINQNLIPKLTSVWYIFLVIWYHKIFGCSFCWG
jgi:hypothetical protein